MPGCRFRMSACLLLPRGVIGDVAVGVSSVQSSVDNDLVVPRLHIQSLLC